MGCWNFIDAEWVCPFCGERQNGEIRFEYGSPFPGDYHIGDVIIWTSIIDEAWHVRLPNDTGDVPAAVECKNGWSDKWLRSIGAIKPNQVYVQWPTGKEPPMEERKLIGCPDYMNLLVRLENNRIKEVFFPKDSDVLDARW